MMQLVYNILAYKKKNSNVTATPILMFTSCTLADISAEEHKTSLIHITEATRNMPI